MHYSRRLLLTQNVLVELSAFIVIVWYTYRNRGMLKFSALIRTIAREATIYFLVMVVVQTYGITGVRHLFRSPCCLVMVEYGHYRVLVSKLHSCEYVVGSYHDSPMLRSPPYMKCIWTVRFLV